MSLQSLGGMSVDTKALLADLVGLEARRGFERSSWNSFGRF